MIEPSVYTILKDFGFPAFLVVVLLWRLDGRLAALTLAIERNTRALIRHGVDVTDNDKEGAT